MGESRDAINVTDNAANRVSQIIAEDGDDNLNLRVYITGGGCSGFQYGFTLDKEIQEEAVYNLVQKTADRVGVKSSISRNAVTCFGDYWRPQYSLLNAETLEAINMLAKIEGILLDPVYTGKAMAGLIDLSRKGVIKKDENVLFVHTGGSPALFAYEKEILN